VAPWAIEHYFRYLMADALGELRRVREYTSDVHHENLTGVTRYVEERYAGHDEAFRARKVSDVMGRCRVAQALHSGFLSPTRLEVIEDKPAAQEPSEGTSRPEQTAIAKPRTA
jgi:hypothetical protein